MAQTRPYLFYDTAVSLCATCFRRIDAKIVFEDDQVFMLKRCPEHGFDLIVQFIDADSFDLRSIKKTCVHIAHPDGQRLIPFDTYNLFYRDALEQTRLAPLRERALASV
jgi:uncharacterized radical SAM superfamily Fe-S cluster-containing enzyme